jgi:hypothetical protein
MYCKLLILQWLPPRDSNPDMLIQRKLSDDSSTFPGFPSPACKFLSSQSDEWHFRSTGNVRLMP